MNQKEIEIFNEIKEFLKEVNNDEYSIGDIMDSLEYFHDKLNE